MLTAGAYILKALDAAAGDVDAVAEFEVLKNIWEESKRTQDLENENKLKTHCIERAEKTMQPIDLKGSVGRIKAHMHARNRNEAIKEIQDLIENLKKVEPPPEIYTSYPITGPKRGTFITQWPLDCSSITLPQEEI